MELERELEAARSLALSLETAVRERDAEVSELRRQAERYQAEIRELGTELAAKSATEGQVRNGVGRCEDVCEALGHIFSLPP